MRKAKQKGFSDKQIGEHIQIQKKKSVKEEKIKRHSCCKQIDTLAAEYPAKTNYLYLLIMEWKMILHLEKGSDNCTWRRCLQNWFIC